jgi:hypothetical protein
MTGPRCPTSCGRTRESSKYLCLICWKSLPGAARRALNKRDARAYARLRELHAQLERGVPLTDISITA